MKLIKGLFALITVTLLYCSLSGLVKATQSVTKNSNENCNLRVLEKGEGCFLYPVEGENFSIPVYYYLPNQVGANTVVLFAMHGKRRNAQDYRNDWRKIYNSGNGENTNFILLAPEFEEKRFALATGYILGNMFTTKNLKTLNPKNEWGFTEIERIFDFVKTSTNITASNYYIYGHSAGAQFVHRMVIFMPHSHIKKSVVAEAGSYTIPSKRIDYPCGLNKQTGDKLPSLDLKTSFNTPMTIILGTKDNKPLSTEHDTYSCDSQQGSNRFERGEYFYSKAKSIANNKKQDFQWTLKKVTAAHIVPNTDPPIEDPMLVSCAAKEFFPKLTNVDCK